jgi:hypothetical protein
MKNITLLISGLLLTTYSHAQMVATMEAKEPIPGTCDTKNIYALFGGFKGQVEPVSPLTKSVIQSKLDTLQFLKNNPKFKGSIMINCIINCKGEMVKCDVDNKSGNDDLDKAVLAIFAPMKTWQAGKLSGNSVDCSVLFSIDFKKGKAKLN